MLDASSSGETDLVVRAAAKRRRYGGVLAGDAVHSLSNHDHIAFEPQSVLFGKRPLCIPNLKSVKLRNLGQEDVRRFIGCARVAQFHPPCLTHVTPDDNVVSRHRYTCILSPRTCQRSMQRSQSRRSCARMKRFLCRSYFCRGLMALREAHSLYRLLEVRHDANSTVTGSKTSTSWNRLSGRECRLVRFTTHLSSF